MEESNEVGYHQDTCPFTSRWIILYSSHHPHGRLDALEVKCPVHNLQWWMAVRPSGHAYAGIDQEERE